jgi:hypothetical protein
MITDTTTLFPPSKPRAGLNWAELQRLSDLQRASARLRATVARGTEELKREQGKYYTPDRLTAFIAEEMRPAPKFRHAERLLTLFGGIAIALLVVVAGFGDSMTFDTACDLCVIMVSAAFTALVMLALIVVDDCRARRARRDLRGNKKGGAL